MNNLFVLNLKRILTNNGSVTTPFFLSVYSYSFAILLHHISYNVLKFTFDDILKEEVIKYRNIYFNNPINNKENI